ncbi:hypothetical protein CRUP_016015 [Coryphaenoides rupestris]|nr:hypothetical protein CRUP_016015 [Coryphaenoides rupestris]
MAFYEYVSKEQLAGFDKYKILPTWLAPNLITFTGFMFLARRTNSSTPLGELFDHGLDSWACIFFVTTVYSIFGRGETGVSVETLYYILWVTISIVYIVTAVVSVETWYKPILWLFLYRDLFSVMIVACSFTTLKHSSLYEAFLPFLSPALLFLLSTIWTVLLYCWTAVVVLAHIHYGVSVVHQLSDHFNIFAFSLKKSNSD